MNHFEFARMLAEGMGWMGCITIAFMGLIQLVNMAVDLIEELRERITNRSTRLDSTGRVRSEAVPPPLHGNGDYYGG